MILSRLFSDLLRIAIILSVNRLDLYRSTYYNRPNHFHFMRTLHIQYSIPSSLTFKGDEFFQLWLVADTTSALVKTTIQFN